MLGLIAGGDSVYRDVALYRYTVKCDVAQMHAIRRAAKRAGKSEAQFVQDHFERILEAQKQPAPSAEQSMPEKLIAAGRPHTEDRLLASDYGITEAALRLWRVACQLADSGGHFEMDVQRLAEFAGVPAASVVRQLGTVRTIGALERVTIADGARKAVWRVIRRVAP